MSDSTLPPAAEQRKMLRAPLIVFRFKVDQTDRSFFGYASNISRSGLFIPATSPREPGSRFDIAFDLPSPAGLTVHCTCEVVWNRQFSRKSSLEPGMGLKFIDLPEVLGAAIDTWVKNQEP